MTATAVMDPAKAVELGALSFEFYSSYFFPKAARQRPSEEHLKVVSLLELPDTRYLGIEAYRGFAKTTLCRLILSKRVAYGLSRTILVLGKSEDHAGRTVDWIRRNIENNGAWARTFGLRAGTPFHSTECCIIHDGLGIEIRILAMGITGSVRGINIDDFRPDFILVDDVCDEENTATLEQRTKIENLVLGAVKHSLAPRADSDSAKMVILQTPLAKGDLIDKVKNDSEFRAISISCFGPDGESTWPERYPTEELKAAKNAAIQRNQLPLWLREMECTLVDSSLALFKSEWLQYWEELPEGGAYFIGIDPTPPPKEREVSVNTKLDQAVIMVVKLHRGNIYVVDYYATQSPDPQEFISKVFEFLMRYPHTRVVSVETVQYQAQLKWELENEMKRRQFFRTINAVNDRRKKSVRISQTVSGRASARSIYCHRSHVEFIDQFTQYSLAYKGKDDVLDAFAIALCGINPALETYIEGEYEVVSDMPDLPDWRAAL